MDYLSLCLIVKNEADYLEEWINYHRLIGVERFIIYDNESTIPVKDTLREYIERGWVMVNSIQGSAQQLNAYEHCLQTYRSVSRWIGFVDTDEFIVPSTANDLRVFLTEFEEYGGLGINWLMFGSNQHEEKPAAGQLLSYIRCAPRQMLEHIEIKTIVQSKYAIHPLSPHNFLYSHNYYSVNECHDRMSSQHAPVHMDRIRVNHYWCRSKAEYVAKLSRGRGDGGEPYALERFNIMNKLCTETNTEALRIIESHTGLSLVGPALHSTPQELININLLNHLREQTLSKSKLPLDISPSRSISATPEMQAYIESAHKINAAGKDKDFPKMKEILSNLIRSFPLSIDLIISFALLCLSNKDYDQAWRTLAAGWQLAPENFWVLVYMGELFTLLGYYDQAEKTYLLAQTKDPEGLFTFSHLALLYTQAEKYDQLVELVEKMAMDTPFAIENENLKDVTKHVASYLYNKGFYLRAEKLYQFCLEYYPEDTDLLLNLGKLSFDMKNDTLAEHYLQKVLEISPMDEEAALGLELINRRQSLE